MIRSLLQELGCEALDLGSVPDTLVGDDEAFESAAARDVILTTVCSVGEEDHIKPAVEAVGSLSGVLRSQAPASPSRSASAGVPFIGCPGIPLRGFVVFPHMARPYLLTRWASPN